MTAMLPYWRTAPNRGLILWRRASVARMLGAHTVRVDGNLRQQLSAQLAEVQGTLDGLLVDQPRRRILRTPQVQKAAG